MCESCTLAILIIRNMLLPKLNSEIQKLRYHTPEGRYFEFWVKRDDLLHPQISGNKYRKLKYNLEEARQQGMHTLLTFGGAFSNHIAATAAAGREFGFKTIGVIRGDELAKDLKHTLETNPTLALAHENGMHLEFVDRSTYRLKHTADFIAVLAKKFGDFYLVPEGGTNTLAVKGTAEIVGEKEAKFDYICSAVGTGGTVSGIINAARAHQKVLGFPALKEHFLHLDIRKYVQKTDNWQLIRDYHFGGFGKINKELVLFINDFKRQTGLQLDPVYTGKMFYGIINMYKKGFFDKNKKVLAIHTGGLQGIYGMNIRLKNKNLPTIILDYENV